MMILFLNFFKITIIGENNNEILNDCLVKIGII